MANYIIRRILQAIIVLFVLSFVCYALLSLMPGDPIDIMISSNPNIKPEDVERLRTLYGLDKPIYERYANWIETIFAGDLGYSRTYRIPVADIIGSRLLNTFVLSTLAFLLATIIGIGIGILAGLRPGSKFDYSVNFFSFAGISIPSFFLAIILIIIFSVKVPLFPAGGTATIGMVYESWWDEMLDRAKYLVLPVISLATLQLASYARYARSSMMETMRHDFIRTARAKGMDRRTVVMTHGFRNALIPIITVVALSASSLFSGALITETIFAYQGIGKMVFDAIMQNDYNVAMISFMISVAMVLFMNLLADILYAVVDPRISYN
ncbi:MAG: ABC transporter permease [Oligoflexales bacterium]|nr:ABC transporter permease [Oligoflexales bacterium]